VIRNTLVLVVAFLLTATSASMAFPRHYHHHHWHGLYNFAPYHAKGGPGPRVYDGRGMGAGAESGTAQ
jgi:hypothetical protein